MQTTITRRVIDELRSGFARDPEGLRRHALSVVCDLADAQAGLWYEFGLVGGKALPVRWLTQGVSDEGIRQWLAEGITWTHADPKKPDPSWVGRFRTLRQWTPNLERDYYPTPFSVARGRTRAHSRRCEPC